MNYNQATEKLYVFISNGSGGIATFQSNLINFLSEAGKTSLTGSLSRLGFLSYSRVSVTKVFKRIN